MDYIYMYELSIHLLMHNNNNLGMWELDSMETNTPIWTLSSIHFTIFCPTGNDLTQYR